MTTTIRIHVNGRYKATVKQTTGVGTIMDPVVVHGNYEGSPNPSGERFFNLSHPATSIFEVTEEQVPEPEKADEPSALELGAAARAQGPSGY